jgi:hypothetical protein
MRILGSHLTLRKFRNPQASQQAKKYTLGMDPKENTTSERTPKKIPPHCCHYQETDCYQETDLELTKKKTPPAA